MPIQSLHTIAYNFKKSCLGGVSPYYFKVDCLARSVHRVSFCQEGPREVEIKRWFRERGHQARAIEYGYFGGWYVKCSKDIALLAKLTFGGA